MAVVHSVTPRPQAVLMEDPNATTNCQYKTQTRYISCPRDSPGHDPPPPPRTRRPVRRHRPAHKLGDPEGRLPGPLIRGDDAGVALGQRLQRAGGGLPGAGLAVLQLRRDRAQRHPVHVDDLPVVVRGRELQGHVRGAPAAPDFEVAGERRGVGGQRHGPDLRQEVLVPVVGPAVDLEPHSAARGPGAAGVRARVCGMRPEVRELQERARVCGTPGGPGAAGVRARVWDAPLDLKLLHSVR